MTSYAKTFVNSSRKPQSKKQTKGQKKNNAGGYSFQLDDFSQLKRFLILGSDSPTFYASENKMVKNNAKAVLKAAATDIQKTTLMIQDISKARLAPSRDPAIFACALLMRDFGSYIAPIIKDVCQTSTDLFLFAEYSKELGKGWGSTMRRSICGWYDAKSPHGLARQVTKYQQRNGWSHRDLLRLSHYKTDDIAKNNVLKYVCQNAKWNESPDTGPSDIYLAAIQEAKEASVERTIELIDEFKLEREHINTEHLKNPGVWRALMETMGGWALLRNLNALAVNGVTVGTNSATKRVVELLSQENVMKSGVHPLKFLIAHRQYSSGKGMLGSQTWTPVPQIVNAIDKGFTYAFGNVEPANKNYYLGIDVSGSMSWGTIPKTPITPMEGAVAMALVTSRTEPWCHTAAFCGEMQKLDLVGDSISHAMQKLRGLRFGRTDCAQPIINALKLGLEVDTFVVYTDNETWCGKIHPHVALEDYRKKINPEAKLIVCGMLANRFTIADPKDPGMLDVVGFSGDTPALITEFSRGSF